MSQLLQSTSFENKRKKKKKSFRKTIYKLNKLNIIPLLQSFPYQTLKHYHSCMLPVTDFILIIRSNLWKEVLSDDTVIKYVSPTLSTVWHRQSYLYLEFPIYLTDEYLNLKNENKNKNIQEFSYENCAILYLGLTWQSALLNQKYKYPPEILQRLMKKLNMILIRKHGRIPQIFPPNF